MAVLYVEVLVDFIKATHHDILHDLDMLRIVWVVIIGKTPGHVGKQGTWLEHTVDLLVDHRQTAGVTGGLKCEPRIERVVWDLRHITEISLHVQTT